MNNYDLDGVCQDCIYLEKIRPLFEEKDKKIETLEKGLEYAKRIEKDYKTKFDKAIEYIKEKYIEDYSNNDNYIPLEKLNLKNCNWERSLQVLDILQGSDKE